MLPTKAWIYYRKVYIHTCRKRERKKPDFKTQKETLKQEQKQQERKRA